jgi:uncharacterized protein (TIGR02246 family)
MQTSAETEDDVEAIRKLGKEFFAAVNTGDLERRAATMDPDIVIMPPDRACIVGKEEFRRLSRDYSSAYEEKCTLFFDEIQVIGGWAFVRSTVTGARTAKSSGGVEKINLKNLWIVRKQANGQWKFSRVMFNSNAP